MDRSWKWKRDEAVLFRVALDDVVILVPGADPEPFALSGGAALWRLLAREVTTDELLGELTDGMTTVTEGEAELDHLLARLADMGAVDRIAV